MKRILISSCSGESGRVALTITSFVISALLLFSSVSAVWAKAPTTPKIAFTSTRDGNDEIYIMNPDGSAQVNLSRDKAEDSNPVWSPDGEQILFVSDRDGPYDLYVMDADGSGVRKVFGSREDRSAPSWSPDGRKIAYVQGEETDSTIYTATIKGGLVEKLTKGFMPSWSPDGREIVFSALNVNSLPLGVFNLRTRTKRELLSNQIPWAAFPAWSPRGNKIAFSQIDGRFNQGFLEWTKANIFVVNRDGAGLHQVTENEFAVAMKPTWSPHGEALIYTDIVLRLDLLSYQLFKTDLSDHRPLQLTNEGDNHQADWFDPTALDVSPSEQLLTTVWGKIKAD